MEKKKKVFTHHHSVFGIYIYLTVPMFNFYSSEKNSQNFYENQSVKSLYYPPCSFGARSSRCLDRKESRCFVKWSHIIHVQL